MGRLVCLVMAGWGDGFKARSEAAGWWWARGNLMCICCDAPDLIKVAGARTGLLAE